MIHNQQTQSQHLISKRGISLLQDSEVICVGVSNVPKKVAKRAVMLVVMTMTIFFFCQAPVCHNFLYRPYCICESCMYLTGHTTRNNTLMNKVWELFQSYRSIIEPRGLPSIPCCMLKSSFTTCINLYRFTFNHLHD